MSVTRVRKRVPKDEILVFAENRDLSQLAMLDDDDYFRGLQAIRDEPAESILTDTGALDLAARGDEP